MIDMSKSQLVTVHDIAVAIGKPDSTVLNWTHNRKANVATFPEVAEVIGRTRLWKWAEVKRWLKAAGETVVEEPGAKSTAG